MGDKANDLFENRGGISFMQVFAWSIILSDYHRVSSRSRTFARRRIADGGALLRLDRGCELLHVIVILCRLYSSEAMNCKQSYILKIPATSL